MGMEAVLIGVGAYSPSLQENLEYPSERFEKCHNGQLITDCLYACCSNNESHELAECLGIDDPFDPNQWFVVPSKINWSAFDEWCDGREDREKIPETLKLMISLKWMLFYRPNY